MSHENVGVNATHEHTKTRLVSQPAQSHQQLSFRRGVRKRRVFLVVAWWFVAKNPGSSFGAGDDTGRTAYEGLLIGVVKLLNDKR